MSRINRARIVDGDETTAASLNDRFDDFSQANAVDQFNLRDAAVDLPQLGTGFQAPFMQSDNLGKSDLLHDAPVSFAAQTSTPYTTPHVLHSGSISNPTFATYSGGLTVTTSDVMRIYWSLSVKAVVRNEPYRQGMQFNTIAGTGGGGNFDVSTSAGCFVAWLQWDITSASLTNFEEVPGQGDFKTAVGSFYGNSLQSCQATTVIPLWSVYMRNVNNGDSSSGTTEEATAAGWRGISGTWHHKPGTNRTIYGLRVVLLGVMHPRRASAGTVNTLVHDIAPGTNVDLNYTGGRLVTFVNRVK